MNLTTRPLLTMSSQRSWFLGNWVSIHSKQRTASIKLLGCLQRCTPHSAVFPPPTAFPQWGWRAGQFSIFFSAYPSTMFNQLIFGRWGLRNKRDLQSYIYRALVSNSARTRIFWKLHLNHFHPIIIYYYRRNLVIFLYFHWWNRTLGKITLKDP